MQTIIFPVASILFYAVAAFLPQLGVITASFSPLLLLLYITSEKRNKFSDAAALALCALLAAYSPVLCGLYMISIAYPAYFIKKYTTDGHRQPWPVAVLTPVVTFIAVFTAIYAIPAYRAELIGVAKKALVMLTDTLKQNNPQMMQEPMLASINKSTDKAAKYLVLMFPAFNFIFVSFAAHVAFTLYLKIKRLPYERFRMPDNLVWVLILGFTLVFIKNTFAQFGGYNIILIMLTLYAYQGFDITVYWMMRLKILPVIRAIIFVFIFSEPPIIIIISFLGLFSVWFDMYRVPQKPDDREQTL